MILSQSVFSAPDDVVQPYVTTTYTYYSNLFLVPPDTPPGTAGDLDPVRSDSSRQVEAGFLLNKDFGLQNFNGYAKFNKTDFEHFTQVDYSGHDVLADWNWRISNVLQGTLGASDTKSLGPYTDFHLQQSNVLDDSKQFATGDLMVSPHWLLHTGVNRDEVNFDEPGQQINDNTSNYEEVGLDYLGSNNGSIGLFLRHTVGDYPNYEEIDGLRANNSYTQSDFKVKLDWHLSSKSELMFLGGYVRRTTDLASLDVYGFNGRTIYNWTPTDKLKFNLTGWHEYSAIQTGEIGYSINTGVSSEVDWAVTNKVDLATKLKYERRDFYYFINRVVTPYFDDATNNVTLIAKYEPRQFLEFVLTFTHDLRSADIPLEGFVGNGASLSASLKF